MLPRFSEWVRGFDPSGKIIPSLELEGRDFSKTANPNLDLRLEPKAIGKLSLEGGKEARETPVFQAFSEYESEIVKTFQKNSCGC